MMTWTLVVAWCVVSKGQYGEIEQPVGNVKPEQCASAAQSFVPALAHILVAEDHMQGGWDRIYHVVCRRDRHA